MTKTLLFSAFLLFFPLIQRFSQNVEHRQARPAGLGYSLSTCKFSPQKLSMWTFSGRLRISIVVAGPGMATAGKAQNATAPLAGSFMVGHSGTWSSPIQAGVVPWGANEILDTPNCGNARIFKATENPGTRSYHQLVLFDLTGFQHEDPAGHRSYIVVFDWTSDFFKKMLLHYLFEESWRTWKWSAWVGVWSSFDKVVTFYFYLEI